MKNKTLLMLGGSGFVGGWLITRLAQAGYRIRVPSRRPHRHRHLQVHPSVNLIDADIHDGETLAPLASGCGAAINLVGILNESRRGDFRRAHVELVEKLIEACRSQGVGRVLHMSALHANAAKGPSSYLHTKGEGEDLVHAAQGIAATSFRPSVIFGPGDSFFNRFATLLRLTPAVFPLACPNSRFAPVYVDDVASAFIKALNDPATVGQRYDLCGPEIFTLRQLVEYTASTIGVQRRVIGLGQGLSRLQAAMLGMVPGKPMSLDNYKSLQVDSVCGGPFPAVFNLVPRTIESVVPRYLGADEHYHQLQHYRSLARRH